MSAEKAPEGVLLLDKPAGITSTRALAMAKRRLGARKAGHTGTLDPFATGLLPLVFGEATKFSRFLLDAVKSYRATLRLGEETASGDPETPVHRITPIACDASQIADVARRFVGVQQQVPPMHSAVRIDGKRLYEHARQGVEIERAPRTVEILELAVVERSGDDLVIDVTCTKGTYVRTLAVDMGRRLGCGAHLVGLRRTRIGPFSIANAVDLQRLESIGIENARGYLLPLDVLVEGLPRWDVSHEVAVRFAQGQELRDAPGDEGAEVAVFAPGGRLVGVGQRVAGGRLAPARLLAVANPKSPDFS